MKNKLHGLLRALVVISRDMFIGLILGFVAAILLAKTNPHTQKFVSLLIPAGIIAGVLKGFTKYIIINIFSVLPTKGYRFNYPKYKLLFIWLALLVGTLGYVYGADFSQWLAAPLELYHENTVFSFAGPDTWSAMLTVAAVIGIASYVYEPPFNEDEALPPETDEED